MSQQHAKRNYIAPRVCVCKFRQNACHPLLQLKDPALVQDHAQCSGSNHLSHRSQIIDGLCRNRMRVHIVREAMNHYVSIFKNSKVLSVNRAQGRVMSVTFELEGQEFMGLNAGPKFKFTEAISFFVNCETQEEVDELCEKLSAGGEKAVAAGL